MQVLKRTKNYTDFQKTPELKMRRLQNDINYEDHLGNWFETAPQIASQAQEPPEWVGSYDFDRASLNAPLQFFARDAQDAGNRAMVGFRLAKDPSQWVNFKAHNIDNAVDVTDIDDLTVEWQGLWTDTNYRVKHIKRGVKTDFVLTGENHPASFTETVQMGAGMTLRDNGNNTISIMKGDEEVMLLPAPFGYVETDLVQEPVISVTMTVGAKINGRDSIVITPNADDLASVGYAENIVIDPTTTISVGTPDVEIEDVWLDNTNANLNYGASTILAMGVWTSTRDYRQLIRIGDQSDIPLGTLTECRFYFYRYSSSQSSIAGDLSFYSVKDNNDWVVGTSNGSPSENGACCWNYAKYNTQSWDGSAGCDTSGTDYDATAIATYSYSAYTVGADTLITITFDTTTPFSDWRDSNRTNNGFMIREDDEATDGKVVVARSTAYGSNEPYFEIDYTPTTFIPTIQII